MSSAPRAPVLHYVTIPCLWDYFEDADARDILSRASNNEQDMEIIDFTHFWGAKSKRFAISQESRVKSVSVLHWFERLSQEMEFPREHTIGF